MNIKPRLQKILICMGLAGVIIFAFQNCGQLNSAVAEKIEPPIEKTSIELESAVHLILDDE